MVRKTAIGSLLPDSNSRRGLRDPFRLTFLDLNMEKPAAASVEETIAPSKRPSKMERLRSGAETHPTKQAVPMTPRVERAIPFHRTGLTILQSVSSPPEKRIKANAKTPRAGAS